MPHGIDSGPGLVEAACGSLLPTKATAPFWMARTWLRRLLACRVARSDSVPYMTMRLKSLSESAFSVETSTLKAEELSLEAFSTEAGTVIPRSDRKAVRGSAVV